ncbi:MAG TPA: molybdopterin cofactor-binding domain-containing protein, partial [Planctomycetota bacterium]|nr:molybdopterin cofactor-binding domain-containing protein [Planctomycetota bacterium]
MDFKGTPLLDGGERVSGKKLFVEDIRLPGMLSACFLRSPHAHATIVSIDVSRALSVPGTKCVITGQDTPRKYGVLPIGHDETALAVDKVRYRGQEVAAAAATSEEAAREALAAIDVTYRILPAYLNAASAMTAPDDWIHEDRPRNIEKEYHHVFGDPAAGFREADIVIEDAFFHPRVTHAAMEPHGSIARHEGGDRTTIWTSTQTPRHVQRGVALALGVDEVNIRVIPCAVGGGFGGKSETFPADVACAVLARMTGRPVRIRLSREEVFLLHRGRPENHVHMRLGMRRDGKITAVECNTVQDGGAFSGYGVATILYSGALLGAIYDIQHIKFDGWRVLTNKPACGPMRGHGTIAARHAFESLLDRAAVELGLDPADVRLTNLLRPGSRTVNDLRVTSYGYPRAIERVLEASGWRERRGKMPRGRGLGLAGSHYVSGAANPIVRGDFPHSTVILEADRNGSITLFTGAAEIGQGSDTTQAIIAAAALGIEPGDIRVVSGDTGLTPNDLGSYSSRVTFMTGNATLEAAMKLRGLVARYASEKLGAPTESLVFSGRSVRGGDGGEREIPFRDAVRLAFDREGMLVTKGTYRPPEEARGGKFPGAGVGPGVAFSYSAQVVEVAVDMETGEVRVLKVWAAHDCGKAINPLAVRGQIEGSVWMGLGQALSEEVRF